MQDRINQGEREGWPDIQRLPYWQRCAETARNSQVETLRRCKDDIPPPSTYVRQPYPPQFRVGANNIIWRQLDSYMSKYFQEDVIGEYVDWRLVYMIGSLVVSRC